MTDEERNRKGDFLENQCQFILSHGFDSVMILASKYDGKDQSTAYWTRGDGNFLARYGQVKEWVMREEGKMAAGECRTDE